MIIRPKPLKKSRYKKIRLDKNEKNDDFKIEFVNSFKKIIKSHHLSSYPETYEVYKSLSKNLKIDKNKILLTNGADGAIENCFKLFISIINNLASFLSNLILNQLPFQ